MKTFLKNGKRYYTATTDAAFKSIFCNKINKDILIGMLEETLKTKVTIKKMIPSENLKTRLDNRNKTLDVVIETDKGIINVEVNCGTYNHLHRRNAAFIFERYSADVKEGSSYSKMNNIIQINLTDKMSDKKEAVSVYKLLNVETGEEFIDNLTIYEFNLPKIKKSCYNEYKLLAALCSNKDELEVLCKGDKLMEKFERAINALNEDEQFCNMMDQEEEAEKLQNTLIDEAKEESFAEGHSEGIATGRAEGRTEEKVEIAKNMLNLNVDLETISKSTGLSSEAIEELR